MLLFALCLSLRADDLKYLRPGPAPDQALEQMGTTLALSERGNFDGEETHLPLWAGVELNCPEALDALLVADDSVEPKLREFARAHSGLEPAHLRATYLLLLRGDACSLPFIYEMLNDSDSHVRYCGVMMLFSAVDIPFVRSRLDAALLIRAYDNESNEEVQLRLAQLFGELRLQEAVPLFLKRMGHGGGSAESGGLGEIGDPSAVPALVKAQGGSSPPVFSEVGKLGNRAAISYLCEHIEEPGAAEALLDTNDPKALEVLPVYIAKLKEKAGEQFWKDGRISYLEGELARLRRQEPREALLKIGEDSNRPLEQRANALEALRRFDCSDVLDRIIAVMKSEPSEQRERPTLFTLSVGCVRAFASSRDPKVTRALMQLGMDERLNDRCEGMYAWELKEELNSRLGTHFFTWKFLHWYLLRAEASQPKK